MYRGGFLEVMAIKQSGHGTHIKHFIWLNDPHIPPQGTEFAFGEQTAKGRFSSFATDGFASLHMGLL